MELDQLLFELEATIAQVKAWTTSLLDQVTEMQVDCTRSVKKIDAEGKLLKVTLPQWSFKFRAIIALTFFLLVATAGHLL